MSCESDYNRWHREKNRTIRDNWGKLSPPEIRELIAKIREEYLPIDKYPYSTPTTQAVIAEAHWRLKIIDTNEYKELYRLYSRRPLTPQKRQRIRERDNNKCVICGSGDRLEVDHIIPAAIGGTNEDSNLQTLCMKCNRAKGCTDITLDRRWLRR
ncbi:MAG: HNH endonuclease [Anaerolineae bacterium]|jgi:hypothetical protein